MAQPPDENVRGGHAQIALPYPDRSFDAIVRLRLLPQREHPRRRLLLKRKIRLNTRGFVPFTPLEIRIAFAEWGFNVRDERPRFLLLMVLHRWTNQVGLSKVAETPGRLLGLTRWLGSPVIIRADRFAPSA